MCNRNRGIRFDVALMTVVAKIGPRKEEETLPVGLTHSCRPTGTSIISIVNTVCKWCYRLVT